MPAHPPLASDAQRLGAALADRYRIQRDGHATYDVAADGRLLLVRRLSAATPPIVAIGWFDQVRAGIAK